MRIDLAFCSSRQSAESPLYRDQLEQTSNNLLYSGQRSLNIGLNSRLDDLVKGGRPFFVLLALTLVFLVIQNLIAAGSTAALGLRLRVCCRTCSGQPGPGL